MILKKIAIKLINVIAPHPSTFKVYPIGEHPVPSSKRGKFKRDSRSKK